MQRRIKPHRRDLRASQMFCRPPPNNGLRRTRFQFGFRAASPSSSSDRRSAYTRRRCNRRETPEVGIGTLARFNRSTMSVDLPPAFERSVERASSLYTYLKQTARVIKMHRQKLPHFAHCRGTRATSAKTFVRRSRARLLLILSSDTAAHWRVSRYIGRSLTNAHRRETSEHQVLRVE